MYRILVVEDDTVIAAQIDKYLGKWGYEVETVRDFADVMGQFAGLRASACADGYWSAFL